MEDEIFFNQSKYIKEMLKKFGLEDSKPTKTPMSMEIKLTKDDEADFVDSSKYRGMIGSLLYLTASRPDIMFSVCLCARFQENPKTTHLESVKRTFRYIIGTSHLGLWYSKGTRIETVVYADSDHAGDYVDRKSTSGVCTFMGYCLTSWFAKKQMALAISMTEAEYVFAEKACQQALWMKQALIDYGIRLDDVPIMCDNKGAIDLSKNPVQHSRTKHIEIRHHFLRDNVQKGNISIEKVASEDNIGDIFTKPLKHEVIIARVISISSDVSVENVGSSFPRVILIGFISVEVPIAPEVRAAIVASPVEVLELDTHSSLEADPSKSPLPPIPVAPMVSPFMCSDDSESNTEMPERHVSPTPHDAMLTRWRSRVASRSSSPTNSIIEIHTAPILPAPYAVVAPFTDIISPVDAPPGIRRRRAILIQLGYTSHHLDRFISGSSSGHSSLDRSSSGHSILGHSLSGHTPPDTTVADSSAPPRIVYPPLARTLWCSEACRRWMSAPLSTMYPSTTSESSAEDSFFQSSAGPSRKRCRSPAATMTSFIHATRALVPSRADLLPPRKRFRDFILPEDSVEEDIDADVLADIEADATTVEVAVDRDVVARVDAGIDMEVNVGVDVEDEVESSDRGTMEVGVDVVAGIDILDGMLIPDAIERLEQVEEGVQDIYEHVIEIPFQRIGDKESWRRGNMTITRSGMTSEAIEELINRRVKEALAAYEVTRAANALEDKSQSQNGSDGDNRNGGNGNGENGNG
ncbi:hypothetical protein Tco_0403289 [Tanacetum coccineum]